MTTLTPQPHTMATGQAIHPLDNGSGGHPAVPVIAMPQVAAVMPMTARDLKSLIFSAESKRLKSRVIKFFGGVDIEIRQPSLKSITEMQSGDTNIAAAVYVLLNFTYVPGTDLKVFDEMDIEKLESLPFGVELQLLMDTWREISGIKVEEAEKNSKASPSS